jgi:hypothetical protein
VLVRGAQAPRLLATRYVTKIESAGEDACAPSKTEKGIQKLDSLF